MVVERIKKRLEQKSHRLSRSAIGLFRPVNTRNLSGQDSLREQTRATAGCFCTNQRRLDELLERVEVAAALILGAVSGLTGLPVLDGGVTADALGRAEITLDLKAGRVIDSKVRQRAAGEQAFVWLCWLVCLSVCLTVQSTSPMTTDACPSYSPAS